MRFRRCTGSNTTLRYCAGKFAWLLGVQYVSAKIFQEMTEMDNCDDDDDTLLEEDGGQDAGASRVVVDSDMAASTDDDKFSLESRTISELCS
jgi:hypothetical protein